MFNEKWGWFIPLYELSGNDLNLQERWLESNILQFLNHLSFLKEKHNNQNRPAMGKQH